MSRSDTVGFAVALLVVVAALAAVPALGDGASAQGSLATQGDFDRTEFSIAVHENGSARWTFLFKQTLSNDTERQEFQAYADRFNENETDLYRSFQGRADSLVTAGRNETGRDMTATDFRKRAYVTGLNDNLGVVEMSFRWTDFAVTDGDRVVVGDVFEGGLYIGPDQVLVISHGDDLEFVDVEPAPDDRSDDTLTYRGERSFADNRPRVVFAPPGATVTSTTSGPGSGGTDTPTGSVPQSGFPMLPVVALLVVIVLGGGAAYAYRNGTFDGGDAASADPGGDGGGGGGAAGAAAEPAISDEELLSDEDRVLKMLEERGGRMKQVKIVDETGWSKSKVSMLLSDMEEDGEISKLRVGRENIVSIAGQEPEAAGSPFDDDE